jgi:glycosyltransferase involved in cell wall biosynthesis
LHETLRNAALVVVPSLRPEPFGNVILEALGSGCRVMAFPGGGPDDLAPLFPAALDVVPRGTRPLAEAMRRWWRSGGRAQSSQTHDRSAATIRGMLSEEVMRAQWSDLVDRLAGMHSNLRTAPQASRVDRISPARWPARTT